MRSNARKQLQNRSVQSRVATLERQYRNLVQTGANEKAGTALRDVISAVDKAAKAGVIHPSAAHRRKSRLTLLLNRANKARK